MLADDQSGIVVAPMIPERYGGGGVAREDYAEGTLATMRVGKDVDGCRSATDDKKGAPVRLLASRRRYGHNAFLIMTAPLLPSF